MATRVFRYAIETIQERHPWFYLEPHIVACVAVMSQQSASPCGFTVECENIKSSWLGRSRRFRLELSWEKATQQKAERLRQTMQSKPVVELAAIALACVLTPNVVDLGQLDVTQYGDRADYRSLDTACVLEISGTENILGWTARHREKVEQGPSNPFGQDVYVIVCLFAGEDSRIRFSYHPGRKLLGEPDEFVT